MATFGNTLDAYALDPTTGLPLPGVELYAWADETGGAPLLSLLSGLDGSFGWEYDTTADGQWVSAGLTGPRVYVPNNDALASRATTVYVDERLATKANAATVGAISAKVDTTEARVGTVEDELTGRLSETDLNSTFVTWENVKAHGAKGDGVTDDTAAIEAALAAGAGATVYFPQGTYVIAKTSRLTPVTTANTALVGDPAGGSVLRFTHANGGLDYGNGSAFVYLARFSDLIIDGYNLCATPLRARKAEEFRFDNVRIQQAVTSCAAFTDASQIECGRVSLQHSPVGFEFAGTTGKVSFTHANFYETAQPIRVTGGALSSLMYRDGWSEACPDLITFDTAGISVGRVTVRDSHFTTSSATARVIRAIAGVVSSGKGTLSVRHCNFSWDSVTTPMVDFSAVDNTAVDARVSLEDLTLAAASYGMQTLIKPHPAQAWWKFYTAARGIVGVDEPQWQPPQGVAGGARIEPLDLFNVGAPEGVIAAPVGSTYRRADGGPGAAFYVKESGTGNTGWVAK